MHEALVAPCTSADTCWLRKAAHLRFPGVDLQYYRYIRGQHVVQVTCCCPCLSGDWKLPSTKAGHAHISGRQNFTLGVHAHCSDVIMSMMVSQIASVLIVCSPVCSGADQRKHQSSALLAFVRGILFFVRGIHQWPVVMAFVRGNHPWPVVLALVRGIHWWPLDSPHKGPVMQKMFPFDDIIMQVFYGIAAMLNRC